MNVVYLQWYPALWCVSERHLHSSVGEEAEVNLPVLSVAHEAPQGKVSEQMLLLAVMRV